MIAHSPTNKTLGAASVKGELPPGPDGPQMTGVKPTLKRGNIYSLPFTCPSET